MLVCGLSCLALTSSNSRVLPEEHCRRRRRSLSSDKSAAAAAVTSAHSYDDMHSTALHCAAAGAGAMLAQLSSPLAVLNNNGFTRKLQVQATLLQAAAAAAARAAGAATGAEDQIPKKSTSLFVWHCNIRAKGQIISECPF